MKALYLCAKCNKEVFVKFGSGKFCSRACANSRVISDETKYKISKTTASTVGGISKFDERYCIECGKPISKRNKSGYCYLCNLTSPNLKERRIIAGKKGYETMKTNGTHHGWQSRKTVSYAERFFIKVLNNHKIPFVREYVVRKTDGVNNYFLDFYIEVGTIKLDLEIDGKQHKYDDRKSSDEQRDHYLESLGYTIYRIDWNALNTPEGKNLMKFKIKQFLEFYQSL